MAANSVLFILDGMTATQALGRALGAAAQAGQIIALHGDLGAGKTTLTQGIAVGMGITARVTSPTFTLVNEYLSGARRLRLIHIDTYRLGEQTTTAQAEAATFGLEEILENAALPDSESEGSIIVIEWAERVAGLLPTDYLELWLQADAENSTHRTARLLAHGPQSSRLLTIIETSQPQIRRSI